MESSPVDSVDPDGLQASRIVRNGIFPPAKPVEPMTGLNPNSIVDDGDGSRRRESAEESRSRESSTTRSIDKPKKPNCGCTCNCRADANDNIPGNLKPGMPTFAFGTATADNCAKASKEAKRMATQALGMQPKHVGCRCEGT